MDPESPIPKPEPNPSQKPNAQLILEDTVYASSGGDVIRITVPFSIATSHTIETPGFSGGNAITWKFPYEHVGIHVGAIGPFRLAVRRLSPEKYSLELASDVPFAAAQTEPVLAAIVQNMTFLLNRENPNPHYGTYFIELDLPGMTIGHSDAGLHISDHLKIRSEGFYQPLADDWTRVSVSPIMNYYVDGARAGDPKSKYFQWFGIIELIEGSKAYRESMDWTPLFTKEDEALLKAAVQGIKEERKKGTILALLSRTFEPRAEKLATFLKHLGIDKYGREGHETEVTADILKPVIDARNKLFHAGETFDEPLLWRHLFPLVTTISEADRKSPLALG